MFKTLKIDQPLAVVDTETTGRDAKSASIIEVGVIRFFPDGKQDARVWVVDPGVPIPADATAAHGYTDEKVRGLPRFKSKALDVRQFIGSCAVACYNVPYDRAVLYHEFLRAGLRWDLKRGWLDAKDIFFAHQPRDLTAAVSFYLGRDHAGAHGAEADALATAEVLDAQVALYPDLPKTLTDLIEHTRDKESLDVEGKFRLVNDVVVMNFGKHKGEPAARNRGFLQWMLKNDFLPDAMEIADAILADRQPKLF